jgi:TolB protein
MPAWSPDGQKVSFITTQEGSSVVYIMNADGSGLQQVFDWPAFPSVLWMPDSQHLVVQAWPAPGARPDSDRSALYLVSLAGGEPLRLTLAERDEIVELVFPAARLPSLP